MSNYCTYLRVSTQKQRKTMLGIEAQRKMCYDFVEHNNGTVCQEFVDYESGTHRDRKGLQSAITFCKQNSCPLVIAKLDRLARDVEFCFKVINTGIEIHFCDMPQVNTLLLGVFASVAQYERELTSSRTKAALAVKKKQGCKMGAANETYQQNRAKKSKDIIQTEQMKKGQAKRSRHLASRDSVAFLKAIKRVFPDHTTDEDFHNWEWLGIRLRCGHLEKMVEMMKMFRDIDPEHKTFARWDFDAPECPMRLRSYMQAFKKSVANDKEV